MTQIPGQCQEEEEEEEQGGQKHPVCGPDGASEGRDPRPGLAPPGPGPAALLTAGVLLPRAGGRGSR